MIYKTIPLLLLLIIPCLINGKELSNQTLLARSFIQKKQKTTRNIVNNNTLQAKGIILKFHKWPDTNEDTLMTKQMQKKGLTKKSEIRRFKIQIFEWSKPHTVAKAKIACRSFSGISSIQYCEPDQAAIPVAGGGGTGGPSVGGAGNDVPGIWVPDDVIQQQQQQQAQQQQLQAQQQQTQQQQLSSTTALIDSSLKDCNIASSESNLFQGELSDYWAQEAIGADLLKEELKKVSPVEKHLVELFDVHDQASHDIAVRNLISGEGKQAVLPELGDKISISQTQYQSDLVAAADRLLTKADNECGGSSNGDTPGTGGGGSDSSTDDLPSSFLKWAKKSLECYIQYS